ncbi:hypothetical protein [Lysobacter gummosus]|uniref:hypothetical protein n=1 Tax=Lysobacter gummosus TaxID=262324 RepID=UPI003627C3B1
MTRAQAAIVGANAGNAPRARDESHIARRGRRVEACRRRRLIALRCDEALDRLSGLSRSRDAGPGYRPILITPHASRPPALPVGWVL